MSLLKKGEMLFAQGDVAGARRCFLDVLQEEPGNLEASNNLGVIAFYEDNQEEALAYFTDVLRRDAGHREATINVCKVYRKQDRLGKALSCIEKACAVHPDDNELRSLYREAADCRDSYVPTPTEPADKENVNTRDYWDSRYEKEIGRDEWRRNLLTFGKIKTYLGVRVCPNDTILDIGCGYGLLLDTLRDLNCTLFGWDISARAVRRVGDNGYAGRVLDFTTYEPGPSERYDYVVSSEFLEHVEDVPGVLRKMFALAEKAVVFAVPNNCLEDSKEHLQCFTRQKVADFAGGLACKKIYIEDFVEEFVHDRPGGETVVITRPTLLVVLEKGSRG